MPWRHETFGIQKIGIDEAGKQHPHPQVETGTLAYEGRGWSWRGEDVGGNSGLQGFVEIPLALPVRQATAERRAACLGGLVIRQARVMASNEVCQNTATGAQRVLGVERPSRGMIHASWSRFNMRLWVIA